MLFQELVVASELISYYDVSGCYILRPWAFAMWEVVQRWFDDQIKKLGVQVTGPKAGSRASRNSSVCEPGDLAEASVHAFGGCRPICLPPVISYYMQRHCCKVSFWHCSVRPA